MEYLYHGSKQTGLTQLLPHRSTYGTYVHATPDQTLATVFSGKNGNDFLYALFRTSKQDPWQLVERIPGGFEANFHTKSSIYKLNADSFKDIATGFLELVSDQPVDVLEEELIEDVYQRLIELHEQNLIHIYFYPNRRKEIPEDDHDLVEKCLSWAKLDHKRLDATVFENLLFLHPKLLEAVNERAMEIQPDFVPFTPSDLLSIFDKQVFFQIIDPNKERFFTSASLQYLSIYPEWSTQIEEKMKVLEKSKEEQISFMIDVIANKFSYLSPSQILQVKNHYGQDPREVVQIGRELYSIYQALVCDQEKKNVPLKKEITDHSILLIGPMGTGKSTIARELKSRLGFPNYSLDHRDQWHTLYLMKDFFSTDEEFELFLTNYILHQLTEATIVDFGAGHSVYTDPEKEKKLKQLLSPFRSIVLLLPSEDLKESLQILNERKGILPTDEKAQRNWKFLTNPTNYEICTLICYTKNKIPQQVADEIILRTKSEKEKESI